LVVTASPAQSVLTLDAALLAAQSRSRQLQAQDAAAAAAREMAVAAGQRPDPTLKVGVNNLPIDGPDRYSLRRDFMTMRSFGVMQELTRGDKLQAQSARYRREAEAAEAARSVALAGLRRDTALAWLDRHYQERMLQALQGLGLETRLQVDAAEALARGGRGAQADVFAARTAVAQVDDRIRATEQLIAASQTRLARWVGAAAEQPLGQPPPWADARLDAVSLEASLGQHPEIELMQQQEALALADVDVARNKLRTDPSVELMFSQRGPAYSNMVSMTLSIPWPLDAPQRQDRELAARLALVEQARAQREEAAREHQAELRTWLAQWRSGLDRLGRYEASLLPLAAERTQAALAAYRGGLGPLAAVLEARRAEIETRIEGLRLEMETAGRWAQLTYLSPHAAASIPTEPVIQPVIQPVTPSAAQSVKQQP
jgi:outer membrane protein TolC